LIIRTKILFFQRDIDILAVFNRALMQENTSVLATLFRGMAAL
jgi:hypothetical protein